MEEIIKDITEAVRQVDEEMIVIMVGGKNED